MEIDIITKQDLETLKISLLNTIMYCLTKN